MVRMRAEIIERFAKRRHDSEVPKQDLDDDLQFMRPKRSKQFDRPRDANGQGGNVIAFAYWHPAMTTMNMKTPKRIHKEPASVRPPPFGLSV
jgi:hypothetical protein